MAGIPAAQAVEGLRALSRQMREDVFTIAYRAKSGHLGSAFSVIDLLVCLYFHHLRLKPEKPDDPDRDRFILSKGHGCSALYAVLAERGFFPKDDLATCTKDGNRFPGHPSSTLTPGVEASTGSLGHGLGVGVGMALAAKLDERPSRTVVMVSDGECDEGSTWEAMLAASHWKLGGLTCIIDYNKIQSFGRVSEIMELEPFADKWRAFGWHVQEIDGHDHEQILASLAATSLAGSRPHAIIAHTVKGKGVSFMEDAVGWHYWTPQEEHYKQAMAELRSC
ncbi:transketolase [Candidatus Peribacteria bacterium RIFCSPLOWO2_12_FULL_55_15]|nr:MAG: transketolase [Candidatus Peribacteria bacterium RIFCSPHIGHO2_01_FULL_54_22]OGJ63116.1 MAG: transketolase [Candidatus Peribacteria bacterium RIFCSPHIGHO2_02_FULL_55_24]OGJ64031.1 MAG: transketolase [Candidatus Peribacteria bacterium RIFCSPHIGHO2_12_FULL_54_10]OGJ70178.1 MAG: transketolase [Candidatus Peribacteria bacterium RIFCSPLOWO2_02_FULL_55_36]OGJ71680.1 MAG: transketolase [Candidatus Peribacteria bacterium RIFCSPLOWO2_12_FULL_55_15]